MAEKQQHPRIVFVGVHMEAEAPFRFLVDSGENLTGLVTLTPASQGKVSGAVNLSAIADKAEVPVLHVVNVNEEIVIDWIAQLRPDLLLVVGWTQLLKEPLLRIPSVAALGFHASLLPKYRGRAPVNWAIINGESETGNTMIVLEPGADEGDIVAQHRIPITPEDTCETIYRKVGQTEVEMLAEVLPLVRAGRLPRRKQDPSEATVMPKRRPEDGVIDWSRSAQDLYNWVRAQTHPYPGAFTFLSNGEGVHKIRIWQAQQVDQGVSEDGLPNAPQAGTLRRDPAGWPMAATGCGWLRLISLQRENEAEISGLQAWGTVLRDGSSFGNRPLGKE